MIHATTILSVRQGGRVVMAATARSLSAMRRQARRPQDPALVQRQGPRRVRRLAADSFALFSRFEGEARAVPRQPRAVGGRVGQGLAHRPGVAPSRGHAGRLRRAVHVPPVGHRRPHRAGRRHHRDRDRVGITPWPPPGRWPPHRESTPAPSGNRNGIAAEVCIYTNANLTIEELGPSGGR